MRAFVLSLFAATSGAAWASTISEEDTILINRINQTDFEVVQGTNFGAAEFWCGAATFIERRNRLSELTPIYIRTPKGPSRSAPGRKAVVFSTSNSGLPKPPSNLLTLTVDIPGVMLKSVKARRYCRDAFTRSTK